MYLEGTRRTKPMSMVKSDKTVYKKKIPEDPQNSPRISELNLQKSMVLASHH
jgi:hypothetical protein